MVPGMAEPKVEVETDLYPHIPPQKISSHRFRVLIKVFSGKENSSVSERDKTSVGLGGTGWPGISWPQAQPRCFSGSAPVLR